MTANLVTGFSQKSDYVSQMTMGQNQNSQGDFSQIFKASTKDAVEKADPVEAKKSKLSEDNSNKSDQLKKTEKVEKDEVDISDKEVKTDDSTKISDEKSASTEEVKDNLESTAAPKEEDVELPEEIFEEVMPILNQMIQEITKTFEVTENQLSEALDKLGFTDVDILNPKNIPLIAVELTDASDTTDIMTDELLFSDVSKLMSLADEKLGELSEKLGLPVNELVSQIKEAANEEVSLVRNQPDILSKETISKMPMPVNEGRPLNEISKVWSNPNETAKPVDENIVIAKPIEAKESAKDNNSQANDGHSNMFTQSTLDILRNNLINATNREVVSYGDVQNRIDNIMNQVSENLRLNFNQDITEMEMQLHPASLGNVRVQVAVKDGAITASFTTQNEQVKEALEAQIVTLKEQMNEQGIKVEAVEVTVSSHAFERNLNEENDQREKRSEDEAKSRRPRRIDLSGLDLEDIEELDEADQVTADMMARNGNTVDYLA